MNRSRLLGLIIGFSLALFIHLYREHPTLDNPEKNSAAEVAIASNPSSTRNIERSPVAKLRRNFQSAESKASWTNPAGRGPVATDEIAVIKAEQQRLIAFTNSLEHNAKRLGSAMIVLLREIDVNRMIQDGKSVDPQELIAEIEAAAPIPNVPYGPKLGLVPNQ